MLFNGKNDFNKRDTNSIVCWNVSWYEHIFLIDEESEWAGQEDEEDDDQYEEDGQCEDDDW